MSLYYVEYSQALREFSCFVKFLQKQWTNFKDFNMDSQLHIRQKLYPATVMVRSQTAYGHRDTGNFPGTRYLENR